MTQLIHKIFHIRVGAEQCWEEVKGSVSNDKKTLHFITTTYIKTFEKGHDVFEPIKSVIEINQNPNHPLSKLAEKLEATIYGGFQDEKNFYIVLPTLEGKKSGDVLYSKDDCYRKLVYWNKNVGTLCINREGHCDEDDTLAYFLRNRELDDSDTLEGNIIEEYARTGIIENDLYKHFF